MGKYLVCGPPGSGKSTFVQKNKIWGDLIVDTDAIYQAVSGLPFYEKPDGLFDVVFGVRDYLVQQGSMGGKFRNIWVIAGAPFLAQRSRLSASLGADKIYVLEISLNECLRRILLDKKRQGKLNQWQPLVEKWWKQYEPHPTDIIIRE